MIQGQIQALVICGPSGSGKSSLLRTLFKDFPDKFGFSVSHTTREPRPGELNGVHYHFTTLENMQNAIKKGEFIESSVFSGNMYGTSKKAVEDIVSKGKICVLDIDVHGVKQIKQTDIKALYVFVKPPSIEVLAERLKHRGTESNESIQRRLAAAQEEITYGETPDNFHLVLLNDSFEKAYVTLKDFVEKQLEKCNKVVGKALNFI